MGGVGAQRQGWGSQFLLGSQQSPLRQRQAGCRPGPTYQAIALQTGSMLKPLHFSRPGGGGLWKRPGPRGCQVRSQMYWGRGGESRR